MIGEERKWFWRKSHEMWAVILEKIRTSGFIFENFSLRCTCIIAALFFEYGGFLYGGLRWVRSVGGN